MTSFKFNRVTAGRKLRELAHVAGVDPDIVEAIETLEKAAHPTVRCPFCKTALDPGGEVRDGMGLTCAPCRRNLRIEIRLRGFEKP